MLVSVGTCERVTHYTCFTVKSSEALYQYTLEGGHEKNTHKNVLPLQQLNTRLKVRLCAVAHGTPDLQNSTVRGNVNWQEVIRSAFPATHVPRVTEFIFAFNNIHTAHAIR